MFRVCVSLVIVKFFVFYVGLWLQSEYVSARDKRRAFVSGFTGSAGRFKFQI